MDILHRSDTIRYQTINSILYDLKKILSFSKVGFFHLLLFVVMSAIGFVIYIYYKYD